MGLNKGIYYQLINQLIDEEIKKALEKFSIKKEAVEGADSHKLLASYIGLIVEKGLSQIKGDDNAVKRQIEISNELISLLSSNINDNEFSQFEIDLRGEILKQVSEKNALLSNLDHFPITPINSTSLFTGSSKEPSVESELKREIKSADRMDFLISFIKFSGLRLIYDELVEFTKDKELRVITTSYMSASDYKAVEVLSKLPNTKVKVSYDKERTRLHAKAYYFHRESGFSTAYVGSSNMSGAALSSGLEWNLKISEYNSKDVMEKYKATFESYWNSEDFEDFDSSSHIHVEKLKKSLDSNSNIEYIGAGFDIRPYPYQMEILDKLAVERDIHGYYKNLVVAATGTGKTVISAFDYKEFKKKESSAKLLFIAHRKEILTQSIGTFRGILKDYNFGELWVDGVTPIYYDHIFASVQTLNSNDNFKKFEKDYFDYIVIDETHHSSADTYLRVLEYFEPKILLGLTATPERHDGQSILRYFDDRIAYEIRLHEAINRKLLSPFHYFGISDGTDLSHLKWERGNYLTSDLDRIYTKDKKRAELIIDSLDKYITSLESMKAVGFCVSKEHCRFMAEYFNYRGIKSINLDSDTPRDIREKAKGDLARGDIKAIFVVDLYNEGVDIPEINTILFLRPTESATVFIQQLGRGLRISEDKDVLTVLDYVGRANKSYSFRSKLGSIMGRTHGTMEDEIKNHFPNMPKGCFIQLEKVAMEHVLENLKSSVISARNLERYIVMFKQESYKELTLNNFVSHYDIDIREIYKKTRFSKLLDIANGRDTYINKYESKYKTGLMRLIETDSITLLKFAHEYLRDIKPVVKLDKKNKRLLLMLYYTLFTTAPNEDIHSSFEELRDLNKGIYKDILDIIQFNMLSIDSLEKQIVLPDEAPLDLYAKYSLDQVLSAFGLHSDDKKHSLREGVKYIADINTDLFFITLNKSSDKYSESTRYEDYAISDKLFHWQSQSRTSIKSETGQRYINQKNNGSTVLLFVRESSKDKYGTCPYYFLGNANYQSHYGDKPISIIYELENKIPSGIRRKASVMVVGE